MMKTSCDNSGRIRPLPAARRLLAASLLLALAGLPPLAAQDEGGGTSGADFLLSPPAARADAMGGVLDGQGNALEGALLNPAILILDPSFQIRAGINPLPNAVTGSQVTLGLPLFGGMSAFSAQLLSLGDFTSFDSGGVATGTVSVYDAALGAAWSRLVWKNVSAGLSAKAIYRNLGPDYTALSFAVDAGAAAWFETPHLGQRPKAPTRARLEKELAAAVDSLGKEKEKRLQEAGRPAVALRGQVEKQEKELAALEGRLAAAAAEKQEALRAEQGTRRGALEAAQAKLAEAEAKLAEDTPAVETWHREQLAAAQARFDGRLAGLEAIEKERARLFAVIDDPARELSDAMIDENIDLSITRTRELVAGRQAALQEAQAAYRAKRAARVEMINGEIAGYQSRIDEASGSAVNQVADDIERLKREAAALEGSKEEADRARLKELRATQSAREKELAGLTSDPWLKRLTGRVEAKRKEIAAVEADVAAQARATEETLKETAARAEKDAAAFEALRQSLKKELRRAKLKRELDVLDARKEAAVLKGQRDYKAVEKRLYQQLLAAMYRHEEKIFQARLAAVKADAEARSYDFEAERQKSREMLDDDFAFQERFLNGKIAGEKAAQKTTGVPAGEGGGAAGELKQKREAWQAALAGLEKKGRQFAQEEEERLAGETRAILDERQTMRLIYLQTDKPYLNTSAALGLRNLGAGVRFVDESYPMPLTANAALGYTLLHTDLHAVRLSSQANLPLYGGQGFADLSVGLGAEYGFADFAFVRAGYTFGEVDRSFSAGFGVRFGLGFTDYAVDYTFRPLPDYGFQHSIGVAVAF